MMKKGANSGIRKDRIDDYRKFWEYDLLPVLRNYLDHIPNLDFGVESAGVPNFEYAVIYVSSYEPTLISYTKNLDVNIVYIRENGRNLRYFPRKQEQIPAKRLRYMFLASGTRQTINTCDYQMINIEKPVEVAYKYMSVDTFIVSLVNRKWRFVEPKKWKDKYEGRFYNADYTRVLNGSRNPVRKVFATCITQSPASEAAWKVYSHGQGLSSKCLQIKIDMKELRKQLCANFAIAGSGTSAALTRGLIYEGKVYYELTDYQIDNLNKPTSEFYETFFKDFTLEKFLKLLLLKRKAYSYEDEIRVFLVPDPVVFIQSKKKDGDYIDISIDWSKVIQEIRVEASCTDGEIEAVKSACFSAGIDLHLPNKKGRVSTGQVRLIKYDVDKMKGNRIITIG